MSGAVSASIVGVAAGRIGLRGGALLLCSVALTALSLPSAPGASAAACDALVVKPFRGTAQASLLVMPPTALSGQRLEQGNVTLSQPTGPVTVDSVRPLPVSQVELAIVLDTAASAPERAYTRARRLARSIVGGLPSGVRVAVVSAGGDPKVLSALSPDRDQALAAIQAAPRSGRHSARDAVALASDVLTPGEGRSAQVLLISTGPGNASGRNRADLLKTLEERGHGFGAVGANGSVDRAWGEQCPPSVGSGQVAAVGSLLTARFTGMYEVVAAGADPSAPLTMRVRSGAVDVRAQIAPVAAEAAVRGVRVERQEQNDSGPDRLWLVTALCVVATALAFLLLRHAPETVRAHWQRPHARRSKGRRRGRRPRRPLTPHAPGGLAGSVAPETPARPETPTLRERPEPVASPARNRFDSDAYRTLSARQLIKVSKRPDDYRGERIIVYGEIVERGPDLFLARTGAAQRWLREHAESGPGGHRRRRLPRVLAQKRSARHWRTLAKYGVGPGLAWQRGLWLDELRPASEQLVGLVEGDIFKAFVQVVGATFVEDRTGRRVEVPSFVIDRITVYASSGTRDHDQPASSEPAASPDVIDLGAHGLSESRTRDGDEGSA